MSAWWESCKAAIGVTLLGTILPAATNLAIADDMWTVWLATNFDAHEAYFKWSQPATLKGFNVKIDNRILDIEILP